MSNSTEFPGNCVTNVHVLVRSNSAVSMSHDIDSEKHDFAEIAYIVCTHAIPASTDNLPEANSPAKILDRLRNAEKQFRQHSILVALDAEKLELFTFYRKVDVVKDQRTILNKFGYVCRLNSCIIANKSAARILDLLKPESSRVYKLFTSAILSSLQIMPRNNESAVSIGTSVYLVPVTGEDHTPHLGMGPTFCPEWQIHRVNLQVIISGQIILTVQNVKNTRLHRYSDLEDRWNTENSLTGSLLYLAPTGQIARYGVGMIATKAELNEQARTLGVLQGDARTALTQIPTVEEWLQQRYSIYAAELGDATRWIPIQIAITEAKEGDASTNDHSVAWKSLRWPSSLTYVFKKTREYRASARRSAAEVDPLKFALDWYNSSAERTGQIARAQASKESKEDADDDLVFLDENHFEDQYNPQVFGPPTFPASQTVYPTPPEAIVTHQTPGMSSVDGLAPTPAPILNVSQPDSEPYLDQEMPDVQEQQPTRAGDGFYHEDLFEDDKFVPAADADEPNWDFFDQPGFDSSINAAGRLEQSQSDPQTRRSDEDLARNDIAIQDDEFPVIEALTQDKSQQNIVQDVDFIVSSPAKLESVYGNEVTLSPVAIQENGYVGKSFPRMPDVDVDMGSHRQQASEGPSADPRMMRRRSSIFEGVSLDTISDSRDLRYYKQGKFWFDSEPVESGETQRSLVTAPAHRERPSSSGSDTSASSNVSRSDLSSPVNTQDPPAPKRTWTEYRHESPVETKDYFEDADSEQVRHDTKFLLNVITAATGEDPFLVRIEPLKNLHRRPSYNPQKSLMIAQILVDQISQSSLFRDEHCLLLQQEDDCLLVDISMDHSGGKNPIGHATLADLTCLPPRSNVRLNSIGSRLICIQRADAEMISKSSILPFWDLLGLQPFSEPKDIITFCIYPSSSNVMEGCLSFMSRLADTYTSCSLGNYHIGRFAGLTNDGLLAWTPHSTPGPNLKQVCQRLGAAIGGPHTSADSTIVVYMVSPSRDPVCCREICHAFTVLFEAFVETSEGVKKNMELVLQLVPMDFVASPDTIIVANQDVYLELALEVYNRVPTRQVNVTTASCGSAVILEPHHFRDPSFELNGNLTSPLSRDGSCLHLAYSYSLDKRWLVAAWSDERGVVAFTMSYCLQAANGGKAHSKREVFRNIWDVSHDVMSRTRIKWRLVVAHAGFYEADDVSEWQYLVSQSGDDRKTMSRLILLSLDLDPDIFVETHNAMGKLVQPPAASQAPNLSGTPVTTPQANTTSPDQIIAATPTSGGISQPNAATPPDHNLESGHDTEIFLNDPADQTWAVLLAYGRNQSLHVSEVRPAAASGLLVRRTGSKDKNRGLRFLGVNLIAAPRLQATSLSLSEREIILQEMLEQYRGLVTLAISRGCINKSSDNVPWHVATAIKGARVLSEAM